MRRFVERSAWAVAPLLGGALALVTYPRIWPCFIPERAILPFSLLVGCFVIPLHLLLTARSSRPMTRWLATALLAGVAWAAISGFIFSNLIGAGSRSYQARTMANMRDVALAIDGISREVHLSPVGQLPEWNARVKGNAAAAGIDGWGNPILISILGHDRFVVSCGACGQIDVNSVGEYREGGTQNYEADIVMKNGTFIRRPEGIQE